jgi:hypothetical protein
MPDWEASARNCVAKFRVDHARHLGDPAFEELVSALRATSRDFCRAWKRHEVGWSSGGRKELRHPDAGTLQFEHQAFHPTDEPEQRLILYTPVPGTGTAEKLERLCAELTQRDRERTRPLALAG